MSGRFAPFAWHSTCIGNNDRLPSVSPDSNRSCQCIVSRDMSSWFIVSKFSLSIVSIVDTAVLFHGIECIRQGAIFELCGSAVSKLIAFVKLMKVERVYLT